MYRLLIDQGRLFRVVAACCAAFYIVAACRAMVPDLCATQRAALEATAEGQADESRHSLNAVAACCTIPWSGGGTAPAPSNHADPSCAFCNLAKGFSETLAPYCAPFAAALPHARPGDPSLPVLARDFSTIPPGRAPPLHRSA